MLGRNDEKQQRDLFHPALADFIDPENPAGNHVVIACGDIEVTLAHLSPGTPDVDPGDRVGEGQPIAEVGNSGNSTEPHLHIHAVHPASGRGVPLTLDGRHPIRNRIYGL